MMGQNDQHKKPRVLLGKIGGAKPRKNFSKAKKSIGSSNIHSLKDIDRPSRDTIMILGRPNTDSTRKRYDRLAFFYDFLESPMERLKFAAWRTKLRERILGDQALEIGVGTGKNLPYYPQAVKVTAIDISPRMLERARKRSMALGAEVDLREMDVQDLEFSDRTFNTVFATFVFCSVPDPVLGLRELRRVCQPEGRLLLLEHMRPGNPILGLLFDLLNPVVVRIMGANINRRTVENIQKAGWRILVNEALSSDIVRWIEAVP